MHPILQVISIGSIYVIVLSILSYYLNKKYKIHTYDKFISTITKSNKQLFLQEHNNVDAYVVIKTIEMMIKISGIIAFVSMLILFPIYYILGNDIKRENFYEESSINNIGYNSQALYATTIIYMFISFIIHRILKNYDNKIINAINMKKEDNLQTIMQFTGKFDDINDVLQCEPSSYSVIYQHINNNNRSSIFNKLLQPDNYAFVHFHNYKDNIINHERILNRHNINKFDINNNNNIGIIKIIKKIMYSIWNDIFGSYNTNINNIKCTYAPMHYNLIKENIGENNKNYTRLISFLLLISGIAWMFIIIFLNAISDIKNTQDKLNWKWLDFITNSPFLTSMMPFISTSLYFTCQYYLPFILQHILHKYDKLIDKSDIQLKLQSRYIVYVFINIISSVGLQSIIFNINDIWSESFEFIKKFSDSVPTASVYFASIILYKIFMLTSTEISRIVHIFSPSSIILSGHEIPVFISIVLINFIFMVYNPIITLFSFIFFCLYFIAYKYRFAFEISKDGDSGGKIWNRIYNYVIRCQLVASLIFILYLLTCLIIKNDGDISHFKWIDFLHPFFISLSIPIYIYRDYSINNNFEKRSEPSVYMINNLKSNLISVNEYKRILNIDNNLNNIIDHNLNIYNEMHYDNDIV